MNKRDLKLDKYGISPKRYKELCGFCEQYPEWKNFLKFNVSPLKSVEITDMPGVPYATGDQTGNTAIKCADYEHKCALIERIAKKVDEDMWEFLIKAICYEVPVSYLESFEEMPMSKSVFYDRRRYFFYLLDKEKDC